MIRGVDRADGLVLVGLVLIGAALGMWLGWPGALAYAGTVLALVGVALAVRK